MVYAFFGGSDNADVNANLLMAAFGLVLLVAWLTFLALCGMIGATFANLTGERVAWLDAASKRIPEVAQFLAEVQAQDRPLLHKEYESLLSHYQAEVRQSLSAPSCASQ